MNTSCQNCEISAALNVQILFFFFLNRNASYQFKYLNLYNVLIHCAKNHFSILNSNSKKKKKIASKNYFWKIINLT